MRWKAYFEYLAQKLDGKQVKEIDFYAWEEPWTKETKTYPAQAEGDCVTVAKQVFEEVF